MSTNLTLTVQEAGARVAAVVTPVAPVAPDDVKMPDAVGAGDLHLAGETVRLEILGVPETRLQAGQMKLKSGV